MVPLEEWPYDAVMQSIAFENGLSETAFFVRQAEDRWQLRWFTPSAEVDLCGHATLGSGFVLFSQLDYEGDSIIFDSKSGPLTVRRRGDMFELDFPSTPAVEEPDRQVLDAVTESIGQTPEWLGRSTFDLFALLESAAQVRELRPDFALVKALGGRGLVVTAPGDDCDFVSRVFAPQVGIDEDPVTGSTHCALVPYWADRLGKTSFHARQLSARGGELFCELRGERVGIAGRAVLYLRGEIEV